MNNQILLLLCALALSGLAGVAADAPATAAAPRPIMVFLFAGQSNMEGGDARPERIDEFPMYRGAGAPQPDVLFTLLPDRGRDPGRTSTWGPLGPVRIFGPELTFARRLKTNDPTPIAIIKSAIGGTTVAFDWNPDAPERGQKLYPRTLQLVRDSMRELERRGYQPKLEAVMWHQGENDMLDRRLNTNYAAGLTRLIRDLRRDLGVPDLKWFLGEASEKGIWGMDNRRNLAILREQQDRVLAADPLVRWVPTSHLAFEVMGSGQPHYHFGTQGQLQLGDAFALAYLASQGKTAIESRPARETIRPLPPGSRIRLFVLAGQRNMEGEDAFVAEIPSAAGFVSLDRPQTNILFRCDLGGGVFVTRDWVPLGPVDYLGNFGPELSFGARLWNSPAGRDAIAIVKFTHSGAQIPDWSPAGSDVPRRQLYSRFTNFVHTALADLQQKGCQATLEGVFWHAGENDTYYTPYQRGYAESMKRLIAATRRDLGQPALTWYITEQHPRSIWHNIEAMNTTLRSLSTSDTNVVVLPTAPLEHARHHFGTAGTLQLGVAMADAYLQRSGARQP